MSEKLGPNGGSAKVIAITGASGFVGKHLLETLTLGGQAVRALVRSPESAGALAQEGRAGIVDVYVYDGVEDTERLERAFRGANVVVHLAARVHVMQEKEDDALNAFRRVNVAGTRSVIAAARSCDVDHLIFLSSVKAVAETSSPDTPLDPHNEMLPSDPYGLSKREAELLLEKSTTNGKMAITVLRSPLVYGPGVRGNMIRLFELVHQGAPLPFGGINNRRSFLYVGNLVSAIIALMEYSGRGYRKWFISDGVDLSTPHLLRLIGKGLDRRVHLVNVPDSLLGVAARVGDVINRLVSLPISTPVLERLTSSLVVDSTPLWSECGMTPPFTPEEGFSATGQWFRETKV